LRKTLGLFLLGLAFPLALMCFRYYAVWHTGTLLVFVIFVAWLTLDRAESDGRQFVWLKPAIASRMFLGALAVVSIVQLRDTALAGWHDIELPYSGSKAAAEFIKENRLDTARINALDIHSFAVLPYFDRNFYANFKDRLPGSFWIWSLGNEHRFTIEALTEGRPEFLLISGKPKLRYLGGANIPGYKPVRQFPGQIIWKSGASETDLFLLYQREPD
jgi:hypothetical protein